MVYSFMDYFENNIPLYLPSSTIEIYTVKSKKNNYSKKKNQIKTKD